jgi:hypothetical protein
MYEKGIDDSGTMKNKKRVRNTIMMGKCRDRMKNETSI